MIRWSMMRVNSRLAFNVMTASHVGVLWIGAWPIQRAQQPPLHLTTDLYLSLGK